MDSAEKAVAVFQDGFNCAQSVLVAHAAECGLDEKNALRVAAAFGGMNQGATCGAVTGALMVLGMRHGMSRKEDLESKKRTAEKAKAFLAAFEKQNGSTVCEKLLGCNPATPEGRQAAIEKGLFKSLCPKLVGGACELLKEG